MSKREPERNKPLLNRKSQRVGDSLMAKGRLLPAKRGSPLVGKKLERKVTRD